MNRTRKWGFVAQEAIRLAGLGLSIRQIAKRLNVSKSSVIDWRKQGKLPKAVAKDINTPANTVAPPVRITPAEWANSVREEYQLDSTDEALVTLAESALSASRDVTATLREQLAAGARFAALVRQLALPGRKVAALADQLPIAVNGAPAAPERKTNPPVRRRSTSDPRRGMALVK